MRVLLQRVWLSYVLPSKWTVYRWIECATLLFPLNFLSLTIYNIITWKPMGSAGCYYSGVIAFAGIYSPSVKKINNQRGKIEITTLSYIHPFPSTPSRESNTYEEMEKILLYIKVHITIFDRIYSLKPASVIAWWRNLMPKYIYSIFMLKFNTLSVLHKLNKHLPVSTILNPRFNSMPLNQSM